jgi:signal transduction histidine kinase
MTDVDMELAEELFQYIGFGAEDAAILRELAPLIEPHHPRIVDDFYAAIRRHPGASQVFENEAQIERQKGFLEAWLRSAFSGDYGETWFAQRRRIGEVHVRIGLPQRYMFAAMNLVRTGVHRALDEGGEELDSAWRGRAHVAIDRLLDVELAIMLQTWHATQTRRLRASERLATLGQVAASIGHELRNPLAVVQTSIHILERSGSEDERMHRHLDRIKDQVNLCGSIIGALLELARDRPLARSSTDLRALAEDVFASVPRHPGVDFALELPEDFPSLSVDGSQLRQLLLNLVQNAAAELQESSSGRVTLCARLDGDVVEIEVRDTGAGIPEEALAHVFEPLFTRRQGGVGLGLALCRRITEKHGGQLSVSNDPEGGARFVLRLPDAVAS